MYLIRFLQNFFKLLKFNIFNELLYKYISIINKDKTVNLKINYFKDHFSTLNEDLNNDKKLCIFNNLFSSKSIDTISLYIFLLNIFKFNGFKPAVFSSFKFYNLIIYLNFLPLPPLLSYNSYIF